MLVAARQAQAALAERAAAKAAVAARPASAADDDDDIFGGAGTAYQVDVARVLQIKAQRQVLQSEREREIVREQEREQERQTQLAQERERELARELERKQLLGRELQRAREESGGHELEEDWSAGPQLPAGSFDGRYPDADVSAYPEVVCPYPEVAGADPGAGTELKQSSEPAPARRKAAALVAAYASSDED
jgi:hypothetical protein